MSAPIGYTTVSASNMKDATGTAITNATIWFAPVDANGNHLSFRSGGTQGQTISTPVSTTVTAGAFSIVLADTTLTAPVNVGYSVTVLDNLTGKPLLGHGYECIQPSGSTWSFDTYTPSIVALPVVQTQSASTTATLTGSYLAPGLADSTSTALSIAKVGCTCVAGYADGSDPTDYGHVSLSARCATNGQVTIERRMSANAASNLISPTWTFSDYTYYEPDQPHPYAVTRSPAPNGEQSIVFTVSGGNSWPGFGYSETRATSSSSVLVTVGDVLAVRAHVSVVNAIAAITSSTVAIAYLIARLVVTYSDGTQQSVDDIIARNPTSGLADVSGTFTVPAGASGVTATSAQLQLAAFVGHIPFAPGSEWYATCVCNAGDAVFTVNSVALYRTHQTATKDVNVRVLV